MYSSEKIFDIVTLFMVELLNQLTLLHLALISNTHISVQAQDMVL